MTTTPTPDPDDLAMVTRLSTVTADAVRSSLAAFGITTDTDPHLDVIAGTAAAAVAWSLIDAAETGAHHNPSTTWPDGLYVERRTR